MTFSHVKYVSTLCPLLWKTDFMKKIEQYLLFYHRKGKSGLNWNTKPQFLSHLQLTMSSMALPLIYKGLIFIASIILSDYLNGDRIWKRKTISLTISSNLGILLKHASFHCAIFFCKWNVSYPLSITEVNKLLQNVSKTTVHQVSWNFVWDVSKRSGSLFEKFLFQWYLITYLLCNRHWFIQCSVTEPKPYKI